MLEAPKTVWVTKYALTKGVSECEVTSLSGDYAYVRLRKAAYTTQLGRNDWHPTREAAVARANEMKAAKIASLKRQIEKLEALEF